MPGTKDILCDAFLKGAKEAGIIKRIGVVAKGDIKEMTTVEKAYDRGKSL